MRVPIQLHAGMSELSAQIEGWGAQYAEAFYTQHRDALHKILHYYARADWPEAVDVAAKYVEEHFDPRHDTEKMREIGEISGAAETYQKGFQERLEQLIGEKLGE
jgi:hypothetical protein